MNPNSYRHRGRYQQQDYNCVCELCQKLPPFGDRRGLRELVRSAASRTFPVRPFGLDRSHLCGEQSNHGVAGLLKRLHLGGSGRVIGMSH
jgi:hypothetical protein